MAHINLNSLSELPFHDLNLDQWIPEGNRYVGLFILCLKIFFNMPAAGIHTTQDMNLSKTSTSHVANMGKRIFSFQLIDLWSDIPDHVKDLTTFFFSKEIKSFLLSEQ